MNKIFLKDIAVSQTGPFGSQLHEKDYVEFGTPIVTVEHLGETGFTHQNLPLVSDTDRDRLKKYLLKEGDIVFSRVGSVDRNTYVREEENGWLFSGRCIRVRVDRKKADPKFISFYFRQRNFKQMMLNISVGATMPSLNTTLMDNIPLNIPELDTQKKIASVLSALDDKIELNNKINSELEAMSKTLYDYWFVQFDFPNANGKPYKSSGGKMVWNEALSREIPEGWEVAELSNVLKIKYGKDHKKLNVGSVPVYGSGGIMRFVDTAICLDEAILIPRKGSLGNLFYVSEPFWSVDTMFFATPTIENSAQYYYHQLLKMKLETLNVGTGVPSLTTEVLNKIKLLISDYEVMLKFNSIVSTYQKRISYLNKQNQELAQLRDWLLPMLMNGQVTVGEAEEKMGMVAQGAVEYTTI